MIDWDWGDLDGGRESGLPAGYATGQRQPIAVRGA
jgi:hypothetical protein